MNKKLKFSVMFVILLVFVAIFAIGCNGNTLSGKWGDDFGNTIEFKGKNFITETLGQGRSDPFLIPSKGTYSLSDDKTKIELVYSAEGGRLRGVKQNHSFYRNENRIQIGSTSLTRR
jgi:hypothetical protein